VIIGLLFSKDSFLLSINETTTWYYFFSSIMETYGTIISILVFVAIYATKNLDKKYLFSWHDVPGKDSERLKNFLKEKFDIEFNKTTEINKSKDNKTIRVYDRKLFSWDNVPGKDSDRLIKFLKENLGIGLVGTIKIEKIDDVKTIRISAEQVVPKVKNPQKISPIKRLNLKLRNKIGRIGSFGATCEKNYLSLNLNDKKTKVNLKIGDVRTDEFMAKTENGELNIYYRNNSISLKINDSRTEENLKIDDNITDELIVEQDNDRLNIYYNDKKYIFDELFWLFTLGIFIIIICVASLYYTEHIWQLGTENVKYFNLNYKNSLLIIVICLCISFLYSMVFFLHELIERVGASIPLFSRELSVLHYSFIGFVIGILINIVK